MLIFQDVGRALGIALSNRRLHPCLVRPKERPTVPPTNASPLRIGGNECHTPFDLATVSEFIRKFGAIVQPGLRDDPLLFGKLHNLSKGGLSFRYTPITDEKLATNSITILPKGKDAFNLYRIECRTIYDMSFIEKDQSLTDYQRRQCGVRFYWLKEDQNDKIKLLLNHYAAH
jgi:hypothetical protein